MSSQVEHTDVGAYALGLLEDGDRRAFEAHLRGCAPCRAELNEMSGTAGILTSLGEVTAAAPSPPPAPVVDMMRRKRSADRRSSRRAVLTAGSAAAAVALAAGIGVGTVLGDDDTPSTPPVRQALPGDKFRATDPRTGASGTVGLVDKGWGTQVGLELRGIKGPLRCHLEAVSRDGERSVVAGWRVPDKGYGVPEQPKPLVMQGGTGLTRQEITRFEVRLDTGGTLLSIPL
ncbi:zf-HC2 domain-containing protein [Actinomadura spongiicola]|uniref:Zf-HC2 domain-containing protein n=1 Tax=Actinomadura spongiicola TaxID=2303421 RepID=A0A372GHX1_9ACTN|nr:zf-HC2 domain-containing protein [Actinomadura spongiicola]RFS84965.1 zf-HC2 domain-containing protein [Actinomadura spongiicola]